MDLPELVPPPIPTRRCDVLRSIKLVLNLVVYEPIADYHRQITTNELANRINKASSSADLIRTADAIAASVAADRVVSPPILRDVVRAEANKIAKKTNKSLTSKVASLEATVKKLEAKKGTKKDFRVASKTARRNAPQKSGTAGAPGNASSAAAKKSSNGNKRNKSGGKKKTSPTGKRS